MQSLLNLSALQGRFFGLFMVLGLLWGGAGAVQADQIDRFLGVYSGTVELEIDGVTAQREVNVDIKAADKGFVVDWSTITFRADEPSKVKSYSIQFEPSERDGIFSAAMATNVFGKAVPLDPMKGQPYVWGRIVGDTLTIFSLYVANDGSYEMQQFDRTLVAGGLQLEFRSVRDGAIVREISTFLKRK
jgi:hypothetical protein